MTLEQAIALCIVCVLLLCQSVINNITSRRLKKLEQTPKWFCNWVSQYEPTARRNDEPQPEDNPDDSG